MHCHRRSLVLGIWLLSTTAGCSVLDTEPAAIQKPPAPLTTPQTAALSEFQTSEVPPRPEPAISENQSSGLPAAKPADSDTPLPINLTTALRLGNAQPLVIAAAEASMRTAVAQYDQAKVLWLPNLYVGASWYNHAGLNQGVSGNDFINTRNQFMAGGGVTAIVSSADAIFVPLAARQVVRSRLSNVQAARNDALLTTAEAYFNVQQARGQLAGTLDTVKKARELVRTIAALGKGLTAPIETDRAGTDLADVEQSEEIARSQWRVASAELARALLLPPNALVVPLEPPHVQVTLLPLHQPVDKLIEFGLTNRPELASQQALVQATLARLRQERMRPLLPIVAVGGDAAPAAPGGFLMGGVFGSGTNGGSTEWGGRNDVSVQVVWELRNLGFGNVGLIRERQAERDQAVIESYRVQTRIAAEVASAYAQLEAAAVRVGKAETGLRKARISFAGNLKGLSETTRFGDINVLVNRPQEAVAALQQLAHAYDNYFLTVNDYNRAQFRLFWAMGYAADGLGSKSLSGDGQPCAPTLPTLPTPSSTSDSLKK